MQELFSDGSSLSNVAYFQVYHLDWFLDADFTTKTLSCRAINKFKCILSSEARVLVLDTRDLTIENVQVDDKEVDFKVLKEVGALGQPLEICLPETACSVGADFTVTVAYKTSPNAMAAQWLPASQTLGKKYPYMFTQCQAIHARSLIPCQDSPGCKFTYTAELTVPEHMVGLMSAIKGEDTLLDGGRKVCRFEQKIPMSSYLLAIAIGAIESRTVGPRSKVWCEAAMIDACEYEFAKVEDMLQTAESLMGPYVWGVYDMLILPPSFPFGGMENPCITFLTPTIVAGDRSLTSVMAHEITHSWTGNLVTNKKWEDFWLNEGFTRFIEGKIVGMLDGERSRQFMAIGGWHSLIDCINDFGPTNHLTALVPELNGIDPDDAFSAVPYEKGYAFLYYIESLVGGAEVFNPFLRKYIDNFKSTPIVTEDFKKYLLEYFDDKKDVLDKIDWDAWLNKPGMPPVNVIEMYDTTLADDCKKLCDRWIEASPMDLDTFKEEDFSSFTTRQRISFLTKLFQHEKPLSLEYIKKMAETYKLFSSNVSDIRFAFLRLCIRSKWVDAYNHAVSFLIDVGRMKFVRPLYKEMFKFEESKELAIETYKKNSHLYHAIAQNMLCKDLQIVE